MSPENILITVMLITTVVSMVVLAIIFWKLDAVELIFPMCIIAGFISMLIFVAVVNTYSYSISQFKWLSDKQEKIEKELTEYPFNEDEDTANMMKSHLESELEKIKKDKSNLKTSMEKNNAR